MKLRVFDTNGIELNIGDLVQIQEKRNDGLTFYSRVQVLNGQLYPFNKFAYATGWWSWWNSISKLRGFFTTSLWVEEHFKLKGVTPTRIYNAECI